LRSQRGSGEREFFARPLTPPAGSPRTVSPDPAWRILPGLINVAHGLSPLKDLPFPKTDSRTSALPRPFCRSNRPSRGRTGGGRLGRLPGLSDLGRKTTRSLRRSPLRFESRGAAWHFLLRRPRGFSRRQPGSRHDFGFDIHRKYIFPGPGQIPGKQGSQSSRTYNCDFHNSPARKPMSRRQLPRQHPRADIRGYFIAFR